MVIGVTQRTSLEGFAVRPSRYSKPSYRHVVLMCGRTNYCDVHRVCILNHEFLDPSFLYTRI